MELETLDPETWEQLATRIPRSGTMAPTEQLFYSGKAKPLVLICASRDRSFHLMLDLPSGSKERLEPSKHAGLTVGQLHDHLVRNHGRRNLIDVKCTAAPHLPAFTSIAKEVGTLVLRDRLSSIQAVNQTIRKWRSFWGKPSSELLTEEQQLGLLSEIEVLRRLSDIEGAQIVDAWKGPLGFRHDFVLAERTLEVKATLSSKRCHVINGIDQLDAVEGSGLFLVSWLAARVAEGGTSLADAADSMSTALQTDPAAFQLFQERLAAGRFNPAHAEFYRDTRFLIRNGRVFAVTSDFPRLSQTSLRQPLSPRVLDVRYAINLDGLNSVEFSSWTKNALKRRNRV